MCYKEGNMSTNASLLFKIKRTWFAWLVLAIGLLITIFLSLQIKQNHEKEEVKHFAFAADQLTLKIEERLNAYALILKGASALFASSHNVTRQEWKSYVQTLDFKDRVEGIGFNQLVLNDELSAHITNIRKEGFSNYTIFPEGKRDAYAPVVYIEPFNGRNLRAFGFDTYSEPMRQIAMANARDTGKPSLTGKIELVQETGVEVQAGTIMYVPVYEHNALKDTIEQRRGALKGWISGVYRMDDLLFGILNDWQQHVKDTIELKIYDGNTSIPSNLLFHNTKNNSHIPPSSFYQERIINFNGHQWLLSFDTRPYAFKLDMTNAWIALFGGFALSFLLFGLLLSSIYIKTNAKRMAKKLTQQLQESEFRWKFAIEGSRDGVWDWNIQTNKSIYSKQWKEMLGYDEYEISPTHQAWEDRIHPEDRALVENTLKAYFQGEIPIYSVEFRLKCKDETYKWILSRGMIVSYDKQGKPSRMIGTHSDINERKSNEQMLQKLYTAIEQSPASVVITDLDACIEYINPKFTEITGYHAAEIIGQNPRILQSELMPKELYLSIWENITNGFPWRGELLNKRKDGQLYWEEAHITPIKDHQGIITHYIGVKTDITARVLAEKKIESLLEEQNAILDSHIVGIAKIKDRRFTWINEEFAQMHGYTKDELLGQLTRILYPDESSYVSFGKYVYPLIQKDEIVRVELCHRHKNGTLKWYKIGGGLLHPNGDESIWSFIDITEQKQLEVQVHNMAFYDTLTQLPNRRLLHDRLGQTLSNIKRTGCYGALMFLDLDNFKILNDTYGHNIGDLLLMEVAKRLQKCTREIDTVARIGGDEFVIILNDLNTQEKDAKIQTNIVAKKICLALGNPYLLTLDDNDQTEKMISYDCSASIGITLFLHDDKQEEILKYADIAMYQAKINGRNQIKFYDKP